MGGCGESLSDHVPAEFLDERLTGHDYLRDRPSAVYNGIALADRAREETREACIEII